MKVTIDYKGKSVEVEIPNEKLEELIANKHTGYERVEFYEKYYYECGGKVEKTPEKGWSSDNILYDSANYYSDLNTANNNARADKLMRQIRRRIAEICEPVDWNNSQECKYEIYFNYAKNRLNASAKFNSKTFGSLYCDTLEHAQQIIDEFRNELTWYFIEYKDRMDI